MDALEYDVFISYARKDDQTGWVSGLRDAIYEDFREFSSAPFRIFFDTKEIHSRQDWELRLLQGLRSSRMLVVCLSPNYLHSAYCRWEWEEFARVQARRIGGGDPVTGVFFVELSDERQDAALVAWREQVTRVQLVDLQPWFPRGVEALQEAEVRARVRELGHEVHDHLQQARRAKQAPGNLRRHNPGFVGRAGELRALRSELTRSGVGVVTAVHGLGGMGKTELAVTYAYAHADGYQGGTWQVDADGQTDMLEAVSQLALAPELGLQVSEEQLSDRQWLGRRVLVRLGELTDAARDQNEGVAACLLLLDNVSEPELLSASQIGVLPQEPWFHVVVTTRLGLSDIGAAGSRASVGMIEVTRLATEDGLALIREHQRARDPAKLHPEFSSPHEEDAARRIVELLDGYALAIEQAAVYLGSFEVEPSQLLEQLRERGVAFLDEVGGLPEGRQAILHKEKLVAAIVDQTLDRLPDRARAALAVASLLPLDTIPWGWLQQLSEETGRPSPTGLPGLSGGDDWPAVQRLLEGRRLLTPATDPQLARLHRVLQQHIKQRLADADTGQRLDAHLDQASENLQEARRPDLTLLAITAAAITGRLSEGHDHLASAGLSLIDHVTNRLDFTAAQALATATLSATERLVGADPGNRMHQRDVATGLDKLGNLLAVRGQVGVALEHYTRAMRICDQLADTDPDNPQYRDDVAVTLDHVGDLLAVHDEVGAALEHYTRSLQIREQLADADAENLSYQRDLTFSHDRLGDLLTDRGEVGAALEHYTRSLQIRELLADADPDNPGYQEHLAISHDRVGNLSAGRGEVGAALEHYTRSLQIRELLADADPDNPQYQRGLAISLTQLGDAQAGGGEVGAKLAYYTRSLQIREQLAEADPGNTQYQSDLTLSLDRLGHLLVGGGDVSGALAYYMRSLHIRELLADGDPDNSGYQREVAVSVAQVAGLFADIGEVDAALRLYTTSLETTERLADADPEDPQYQGDLSLTLYKVGDLLADRGEAAAALEHHTRSLHICERLADADPHNPKYQQDVWARAFRIGDMLESSGDQSASDYYSKAHRTLAALDAAGKLSDHARQALDWLANKLGPR